MRTGTITRRYINGPKTVKFELERNEVEKLFNLVIEKEIWDIQRSDLSKNCQYSMMPSFSTNLEIILNSSSAYRFDFTSNNCSEQINDLLEIVEMLNALVAEHTEGMLHPTDINFE